MQERKADIGRRAWNILRLALLWARKGSLFKRRLMMDMTKHFKTLRLNHNNERSALHYGEHELSFDDTPTVHVKMSRPASLRFKLPHIPCINPQEVDFDYDFNDDDDDRVSYIDVERKSFLKVAYEDDDYEVCAEIIPCEDEGIDLKAEEFIAKFHQQMKLQRQISYLQYTEMLNRGAS